MTNSFTDDINDNFESVKSEIESIKTNYTPLQVTNAINSAIANIPSKTSDLTNDSGYITGINSTDVTTALGYTPESTSNKVTSISSSSTDTEYPSAKSVVELLKTIYPVGAIFIGTTATCPMSALFGTWTLVAEDRCLQGASTNHSANTTVAAGLPNITGSIGRVLGYTLVSKPFYNASGSRAVNGGSGASCSEQTFMDLSTANSIYGNSTTVQPPAYVVNVWRRTA